VGDSREVLEIMANLSHKNGYAQIERQKTGMALLVGQF